MAALFDVQGFGALSEWNGQFSSASAQQAFQNVAATGANSIELSPRIWTQTGTSTSVFADSAKTESNASLAAAIQTAHADGLSVVLKPEISALDGTGSGSLKPSDVAAFFASYKAEIVHLATLAEQSGVETLALGNEMSSLSGAAYLPYWTDIISTVRSVYHGTLTYAAATDEAAKVSFWSQLDTIGVNTYPPLSATTTPTVADLVQAWNSVPANPYYAAAFDYKSPVDFLHSLAEQYGKPVLMTEVGYRSLDGTTINPGSWTASGTADVGEQADAYNAFFQVWGTQGGSWFQGAEFWQWDLNNVYSPTGYSPMGKPALGVLTQYFHDSGPLPNLTVTGSAVSDVIDLGAGDKTIVTGLGNDIVHVSGGNNVIYAGPQSIAPLATSTITLTGYGGMVNGTGAQVQIFVNGQAVGGLMTFTPASDPSGYQTYSVTFANPAAITSVDVNLMNAASGRALHLKDFSINGVDITPSETANASSPGTFDLYVRSIHLDATGQQDIFYGTQSANDTIIGGSGNDTIYAGAGSDTIDGGGGTNTVIYAGNRADYAITAGGGSILITKSVNGGTATDHLSNIQAIEFADQTVIADTLMGPDAVLNQTLAFADHSRDVYSFGIAGKSYVSEHDVINSAGHTTLVERFDAAGDLLFTQVLNADGSKTISDYAASGALKDTMQSWADGSYDQFTFDASGSVTGESIRHADDSRDVFTYGIVGKSYTTEHDVINSAGHTTLIERLDAWNHVIFTQALNADDSKTVSDYDTAGHLVDAMQSWNDGSYDRLTFDAAGNTTSETIRHADATRDVYTFGITGEAYSAEHDTINAAGHTVERVYDNNDGSHTITASASGLTLSAGPGESIFNSYGGDTFAFTAQSGASVINNFHPGDGPKPDTIAIDHGAAPDLNSISVVALAHASVLEFGSGNSITLTNVTATQALHSVLIT